MKYFFLIFLLPAASLGTMAAPQDTRPPLSKDEIHDFLMTSTPSKVIVSTIQKYGIAFQPTAEVLEEFRRAGAPPVVLAALRMAWRADAPKPLGDKEIRMLLAEDEPSDKIVAAVQQRGIDFRPSADYLDEIRSEGAQDALIQVLRSATPRPFTKDELLQLLASRVDQIWIAQRLRERGINFNPEPENLQILKNRGAGVPLMTSIRSAKRVMLVLAREPEPQSPPPPTPDSHSLVAGTSATLTCAASDKDVPVFASPDDLGNIASRLHCGDQITFVEKVASPPGIARIKYADGKEGFVSNAYLEAPVATVGSGVSPPVLIYKPEPAYTQEARRDGLQGTVQLRITIDAGGNVGDVVEISNPLGEGLDQNAIDTVKTWRFTPSHRDGIPVAVRVQVEVSFRL